MGDFIIGNWSILRCAERLGGVGVYFKFPNKMYIILKYFYFYVYNKYCLTNAYCKINAKQFTELKYHVFYVLE